MMSSLSRTLTLAALLVAVSSAPSLAGTPIIRPGYVIIKLKPAAAQTAGASKRAMSSGIGSLDQLNIQFDVRDFRQTVPTLAPSTMKTASGASRDVYGLARYFTIEIDPAADVLAAVAAYAADPNVEVAEPDYLVPLDMVPNDPDYADQWTHFDPQDDDIDTQDAWEYETGDSTVIVGVIDSGIQHDHPDLYSSVWVNPGEDLDGDGVPWDADDMNGLDDDGNSLVDDLIGWDFMNFQSGCWAGEDCNLPDNNPADFAGHGTHVNGIVGAVTGNGIGVAGIAGGNRAAQRPGVKLMGLRAGYLANTGQGFVIMSSCAAAADYAVSKGAMGINCSWGSSAGIIQTAIANCVANGLVVCVAAGNDNTTSQASNALSLVPGVLDVASLDASGLKSGFSNYGTWIDISAPGNGILNTYSNLGVADYAILGGTSMASPTVLGVAALLKSHHPWFTKTQIDTLLMYYADSVDVYTQNTGYPDSLGHGRVNAYSALSILTTADYSPDVTFGTVPLTVNFTNTSLNAPNGPYDYAFGDGDVGAGPDAMHIYDAPGVFTVEFTGNGPSGPHTRINPNQIVVVRDSIIYGDTIGLAVGNMFSLPIRLNNTHPMKEMVLPVRLTGPADIRVDSLTLAPLLANWANNRIQGGSTQGAWRLQALTTGEPVPVGGGTIAYFWFTVHAGTNGQVESVDSATVGVSQHTLKLISDFANFKPYFEGGSATIGGLCDCSCHGDPICDGNPDVLDVVSAVGVAFRNLPDSVDASCSHVGRADMNCDCVTDVLDVVTIVNRAFRNDATPPCDACVDACP